MKHIDHFEVDDPRWLQLVSDYEDACIFHHPVWNRFVADCYGYHSQVLVILSDNGRPTAGLPVMETGNRLYGRQVVSLPFSDFCQPLARDDEAFRELTRELINWQQQRKDAEFLIHWDLDGLPGVYQGEAVLRHTTRLKPQPDDVFRSFKKTQVQQRIHKSEKEGVIVRRGESWSDLRLFYDLHLLSRQRFGTPIQPVRFFKLLWDRLLSKGFGFVLLAYRDSSLLAGAVFLHWNRVLTYKFSAYNPLYLNLRPNNMMLWHAIRWGCENGYKLFDWGRTDIEDDGLRDFKRGWASEEKLMHYSILAGKPPKPSKIKRVRPLLTKFIQHSPPWVCRLIGELFYKYAA